MSGRGIWLAALLAALMVAGAVATAACAQPPEQPPSGTGPVLPPESPPADAPGGGPVPGSGPGGPGGPTMPGARPGVEGEAPGSNTPDDNRGFATEALPEDIRKQLEAILPTGEPAANGKLSIAFAKTEIDEFLSFLATESGYTILTPAELSGQITVVSRVDVTLEDAFAILEAWLRIRNFTTARDDTRKIMTIVPLAKARTKPRPVLGPDALLDSFDPNEIVTQVLMLRYVDATKVTELLTPLVDAEWAQITASADLNALIVTDTTSNIGRLMTIIQELDRESETVTVKVIPLEFAPARETAELLDQILGQASPIPPEMLARMGMDPNALQQGPSGLIGAQAQVKISADQRTNSLVILASAARIEQIEKIIKDLDKDTSAKVSYRVVQLQSADATQVADLLNQIFEQPQGGPGSSSRNRGGGIFDFMFDPFGSSRRSQSQNSVSGLKENVVVADTRTNSVIVTAAENNMKAYEDMIKSLDESHPLSEMTHVYRLKNALAADISDVLGQAFQGTRRRQGGGFLDMIFGGGGGRSSSTSSPLDTLRDISVTADEKSNSLIVTGPPQAFATVDQMIQDLDMPQKQVYISVIIADVTLTDTLRYGVEWDWFTRSNPSVSGSSNFGLSGWDQGIRWGVIGDQLQGFLEALNQKTSVRVISTPSILTTDNVQGTISSGREITVKQGQRESTGGSITDITGRVEAAIKLTVTPRVNQETCRLSINQTVDDIGQPDSYGNPEIIKRNAQADVVVRSGETIVLGGIIQEDVRETRRDVPVLSEIPVIGQLFKSREKVVRRSELMVFITPFIIEDPSDTGKIRSAVEEDLKTRFPNTDIEGVDPLSGLVLPGEAAPADLPAAAGATSPTRRGDDRSDAWPPITRGRR